MDALQERIDAIEVEATFLWVQTLAGALLQVMLVSPGVDTLSAWAREDDEVQREIDKLHRQITRALFEAAADQPEAA